MPSETTVPPIPSRPDAVRPNAAQAAAEAKATQDRTVTAPPPDPTARLFSKLEIGMRVHYYANGQRSEATKRYADVEAVAGRTLGLKVWAKGSSSVWKIVSGVPHVDDPTFTGVHKANNGAFELPGWFHKLLIDNAK